MDEDGIYNIGLTDEWREGDRFEIMIDFETKEMTLTYNDRNIGNIHEKIVDEVQLAICIYDSLELQCTKYQFN